MKASEIKNLRPTVLPSIGKGTGFMRSRPNIVQDKRLSQRLNLNRSVPESPSLNPKFFPRIGDQGQLGSCTGWAARSCLMVKILEKDTKGVWRRLNYDLYPLALYFWARQYINMVPIDSGAYIKHAVAGAGKYGAPREDGHPYSERDFARHPTKKALEQGSWHQAVNYYRCDEVGVTGEKIVDNMLIALDNGLPLDFGFICYDNLWQANDSGTIPMPVRTSREEGGHSMASYGADTQARLFFGPNSWSKKWGMKYPKGSFFDERGYFAIPFQFFIDGLADDIWAIDVE